MHALRLLVACSGMHAMPKHAAPHRWIFGGRDIMGDAKRDVLSVCTLCGGCAARPKCQARAEQQDSRGSRSCSRGVDPACKMPLPNGGYNLRLQLLRPPKPWLQPLLHVL